MYPGNPNWDYGLATTDVRHAVTANALYSLPWQRKGPGVIASLVNGWSVGGILTLRSGLPFTPQLGFNPTNNGDSRNPIRPSWKAAPVVTGNPNRYFNPLAFVVPDNGTYGNAGRDTLIGPGLFQLDASAIKNTKVRERLQLQFRAESFNVTNHANWNTPNPVVFTSAAGGPAPTAGVITATSTTSRQLQFGMKLLF